MRNVLNLYTKQLNNKKKDVRQKQDNSEQVIDRLTISAAGKQKAIMERITSDIVKKIFNNTLGKTVENNASCSPQKNINGNLLIKETSHTELVFNTIDNNNTKQRDTLEITGSDFVPVP